jgi:hypothetical protein
MVIVNYGEEMGKHEFLIFIFVISFNINRVLSLECFKILTFCTFGSCFIFRRFYFLVSKSFINRPGWHNRLSLHLVVL